MNLYSDFARHRARQLLADVVAVGVLVASVFLGVTVYTAILAFRALGAGLQSAGSGFEGTMADAADALGGVPLIGDGVRAPFDQASGAGAALAAAGADQQELVAQAALVLGALVALVPIVIVVRIWLMRRIAFARRAAQARELAAAPGGMDLLALRAIGSAAPSDVLKAHPDPAGAWRRGEPEAVRALARLELAASGVRIP